LSRQIFLVKFGLEPRQEFQVKNLAEAGNEQNVKNTLFLLFMGADLGAFRGYSRDISNRRANGGLRKGFGLSVCIS
jgi:hypothetical protein